MELYINSQGLIRAIYDEALSVRSLGTVHIRRASHVEPDDGGNWWADLEPSGGPILGPFPLRSAALDAEHDWLTRHVLDPTDALPTEGPNTQYDELPRPDTPTTSGQCAEATLQTAVDRPDLSCGSTDGHPQQHARRAVCANRPDGPGHSRC